MYVIVFNFKFKDAYLVVIGKKNLLTEPKRGLNAY